MRGMRLADGLLERNRQAELEALVATLRARGYHFVPPTPATHARVLARDPGRRADSLEDVLGWSRAFLPGRIDPEIERLLESAGAIEVTPEGHRSRLRAASVEGEIFLHSAYPTTSPDAVFLGPDSYRFARLILAELERSRCLPGSTVVDIGTGAGVGGIVAARHIADAELVLTDINPVALQLAAANAAATGVKAVTRHGALLAGHHGAIEFAVANPPYIIDDDGPAYRNGGDRHGAGLSIEMASAVLPRLARDGRLVLYTGSAIVSGEDALHPILVRQAQAHACTLHYAEIDPDVFGEELEREAYADVDRIAVVSAIFTREKDD
ncbi:MAG TPA: methyltransferase, partial [Sphingomonas sp.]|nr:methyltransferase [Sphingomonas sp.]